MLALWVERCCCSSRLQKQLMEGCDFFKFLLGFTCEALNMGFSFWEGFFYYEFSFMPVWSLVMSPPSFWLSIICVFSVFFLISLAKGLSISSIFSEATLGFVDFSLFVLLVCWFLLLISFFPLTLVSFFNIYFIYLAMRGLSCSMQDLPSSLNLVPWPGIEYPPLQSLRPWTSREVPQGFIWWSFSSFLRRMLRPLILPFFFPDIHL